MKSTPGRNHVFLTTHVNLQLIRFKDQFLEQKADQKLNEFAFWNTLHFAVHHCKTVLLDIRGKKYCKMQNGLFVSATVIW